MRSGGRALKHAKTEAKKMFDNIITVSDHLCICFSPWGISKVLVVVFG
jgi:hypothetical protein